MRLVVLADVQGNRWGLEAVLERAKKLGADETVLLGSAVGAGPDPRGTVELLRKRGVVLVRGPRDDAALGLSTQPTLREEGDENARRLQASDLAYLRAASPSRRMRVHDWRVLLTSDPMARGLPDELVVQPGTASDLGEGRVRLASAAAAVEGEVAFLVLDESGPRLDHAAWDVVAHARMLGRTRHD